MRFVTISDIASNITTCLKQGHRSGNSERNIFTIDRITNIIHIQNHKKGNSLGALYWGRGCGHSREKYLTCDNIIF